MSATHGDTAIAKYDGQSLRFASPISYDLTKRLFLSDRCHLSPVAERYVAFNPDYPGGPILTTREVHELLRAFSEGAAIGDVLSESPLAFDDALIIIDELYDRGFLRSRKNSARYTADERTDNPISSISLWVHINNHCNLDCSYCFVDKFKAVMSDEVISETTTRIRQTVQKRRIKNINVAYAGGEPTLSLNQISQFSTALNVKISDLAVWCHEAILTNGTNVTDKLIAFCLSRGVSIGISLDGYGSESHDKHRIFRKTGKGSWDIIERNISRLKEAGIKPYIMVVTSAETCDTLGQLVKWIADQELSLRLSIVRQPDGVWAPKDWQAAYRRLIDRMIPTFEEAFTILESKDYSYDWCRKIRICELHFESPSYSTSCGIGSSHIVVQDDGNIASCPMTIREQFVAPRDDLLSTSRKTISISPRTRNDSSERNCLDCKWFPVCVSGCPVTNERVKGQAYTISPMHDFYEYIIPRFVNFLGSKIYQATVEDRMNGFHIVDDRLSGYVAVS